MRVADSPSVVGGDDLESHCQTCNYISQRMISSLGSNSNTHSRSILSLSLRRPLALPTERAATSNPRAAHRSANCPRCFPGICNLPTLGRPVSFAVSPCFLGSLLSLLPLAQATTRPCPSLVAFLLRATSARPAIAHIASVGAHINTNTALE